MKKILLILAVVAMLLPGCKKIEESIDALENRIEVLENETIPTIDEQIAAINVSLDALDTTDKELKSYIDGLTTTATSLQEQINTTNTKIGEVKVALQKEISTAKAEVLAELETLETELKNELSQINDTIETLKTKDAELDKKIADLRTYVDTELGKTTDWVNATFATLTQYNALVAEVTAIKAQIETINKSIADLETRLTTKINEDIATAVATLNSTIQQKVSEITTAYTNAVKTAKDELTAAYTTAIATAISNLETSLKSWVGEQLSSYYTIAEVDAKILALQNSIKKGDEALQTQLNLLKEDLQTMKTELTTAYQKAIEDAITTNNGVIDTKIANEIASVNQRINNEVATINAKISAIEARLDNIEARLEDVLARIQSVSYIPQYSDGNATVKYVGTKESSEVTLDFKVSPKECVAELANVWKKAVKVESIYTQTRAVSFVDMPVQYFEADEATGVITIVASGKNLSDNFFADTQSASVALAISDGNNSVTTDYIPMVAQEITNEIWYTSTDGAVVTPSRTDVFEADIISNTYENGKGVIKFDGEVTKIGYNAFLRCTSLNNVVMPNSVVEISSQAFAYCNSLKNAIIPKNVMSIEERAFRNCTKLSDITIPDSVIKIGREAFNFCTTVKYITIGKGVNTISEYAFSHCFSVKAFYGKFASEDNRCLIVENTLEAFASSGLTEYTIPDGVTTIATGAFSQHNLEYITLPNSLQSIESSAFSYCDKLIAFYGPFVSNDNRCIIINGELVAFAPANINKYIIPDNATHICKNTFGGCVNLTEISIPEGVKTIGSFAFARCSALKTITIPESVISIGGSALGSCTSLTEVYCKPTTPPTGGSDMFDSNASGRKIYVPIGSGEAYKAKSYWSDYADSIEEKEF